MFNNIEKKDDTFCGCFLKFSYFYMLFQVYWFTCLFDNVFFSVVVVVFLVISSEKTACVQLSVLRIDFSV